MRRALIFILTPFSVLGTHAATLVLTYSTFLPPPLIHVYLPYHDQTLLSDVPFGTLNDIRPGRLRLAFRTPPIPYCHCHSPHP